MLHSKPICWTNNPANLSRKLKMPVKTIEETQKTLLYKSLLNSAPVIPQFLKEYQLELSLTVVYLRELEKIPISIDEMKDGFQYFTHEIDADLIDDEVKKVVCDVEGGRIDQEKLEATLK